MDSRERVALTLNHEKAERMPINFRAVDAVGESLQAKFGVDYEGLLRHWHVDFREIIPPYCGAPLPVLEGDVEIDIWGVGRSVVEHANVGRCVVVMFTTFKDVVTVEDVVNHHLP